jgi:YHS domain-containing protein
MRHQRNRGLSTVFFLATGIVIGVIIVVVAASVIKWKMSAQSSTPTATMLTATPSPPAPTQPPGRSRTSESAQGMNSDPRAQDSSPSPGAREGQGMSRGTGDETARLDLVKDPVCGKMVNPNTDLRVKFKARDFCFCSETCLRTFKDDPFPYIDFTMKVNISIEPVQKSPGTPSDTDTSGAAGSEKPSKQVEAVIKTVETPAKPVEHGAKPTEHGFKPAETTPRGTEQPPAVKKPPTKAGPTIEEIPLNSDAKPIEKKVKPPKTGGSEKPASGKKGPGELHIEEIPLE